MITNPTPPGRHPRVTVVIPTKNRASYLVHTLRTCMVQNYEPLEILVADDASTDETRQVTEDAARLDPRIRYLPSSAALGMRDNFERALAEVKPGLVMALGGDDGLLPNGVAGMVDVLRETETELLTWPAPIYRYPSGAGPGGQLNIARCRGTRTIDSQGFLRRQARRLHYLSDIECPMFYVKGVASTELVDRVRRRTPGGRFYASPTPDGYSGIVLAGEVRRFGFSGRPFSIYGLTPQSQGQAYLSNDEKAKELSDQFVQSVASTPMHRELASQPYSPLITLMTADYLLTARDLPGWPGDRTPIDFKNVLASGLSELQNGLYGADRLNRELAILNEIARMHQLGDYFADKVKRATRRAERTLFEGTGINTNAILLDGAAFRLHSILDAAYAADALYQAYVELTPRSVVRTVVRSIRYRLTAVRGGTPFPPPSAWNRPPAGGPGRRDE